MAEAKAEAYDYDGGEGGFDMMDDFVCVPVNYNPTVVAPSSVVVAAAAPATSATTTADKHVVVHGGGGGRSAYAYPRYAAADDGGDDDKDDDVDAYNICCCQGVAKRTWMSIRQCVCGSILNQLAQSPSYHEIPPYCTTKRPRNSGDYGQYTRGRQQQQHDYPCHLP